MSADALGVGHRLSQEPSDLLAATAFAHELEAASQLWHGMAMADLAHALALDDAGLLPAPARRDLLPALLATVTYDAAAMPLDPKVGDIYNNRDRHLRDRAGAAAGFIHTGRARREASTIGWQLECRRLLLELGRCTADLLGTLVETAEHHVETVMPDFTYLHRAQPTTLAHYLLGHAAPIARHLDRIDRTLTLVNSSPAGSGSTNGSRLPIRRELLAELLGFDGLLLHTRDAMWASDMALDVAHVCVQVMTSIDRLAEELQIWTTEAFRFLELSDELSRTSVVMPHKKNPYSLTYLRGAARHAVGTAAAITTTQLTASGQPDNRTIAYLEAPQLLDQTAAAAALLAAVVSGGRFGVSAMRAAASTGFTTSTEICDELTLRTGLDNRTVHGVVGSAVRTAVESDRTDIGWTDFSEAAAAAGISLDIDAATFERLLDPDDAIARRVTPGGVGRSEVDSMCRQLGSTAIDRRRRFTDHPSVGYDARLVAAVRSVVDAPDDEEAPRP